MKGIIVVFLLIVVCVAIWLIAVGIHRTSINYRKRKRDMLGKHKSKPEKEEQP
jgi:hypothetical protein